MIERIKNYYWLVATTLGVISLLVTSLWGVFTTHNMVMEKYEDLVDSNKTIKQLSLKSIIWNDKIPVSDQMSACDEYINEGFNSLTKKHCEKLLSESDLYV